MNQKKLSIQEGGGFPFLRTKLVLNGYPDGLSNGEKVSENDIFSFSGLTDEEIIKIVNTQLNIDIKTSEGLGKLNEIFFKGLDVYKKTIGRLKKYKIKDNEEINGGFDDWNSVISFLKESSSDSTKSRINCAISKVCRSVHKVLSTPSITDLNSKGAGIISKLKENLSLEVFGDDYIGHILGGKSQINFLLTGRIKSFLSCVMKNLHDPKYHQAEQIKDGLGYTFKVKSWEEAIILMQYLDILLGSEDLKVKSKISEEELKTILSKLGDKLNPSFCIKLNKCSFDKKSSTSEDYLEIKLVGILEGSIPVEFKFILSKTENENGLNFQPIYAMLKKDLEGNLIRILKQYADDSDIEAVVEDFILNLQNHINSSPIKKGTKVKEYLYELFLDLQKEKYIDSNQSLGHMGLKTEKRLIKNALVERLKTKMKKVRLEDGRIVYTSERALKLSQEGVYQNMEQAK